jgi:hypothetical protein
MQDKETVKKSTETLIQMTGEFCDQYLDQEYKELSEKLIRKMSRKKAVPFLSGKIEIWAAAVIYALGRINFLFDKSTQPYATPDDICNFFGTSKSTTGQKAKAILDMFKLHYFDTEFSTKDMLAHSPFSNVFFNGVPVPISFLPPELQEIARANPKKPLTVWSLPDNAEDER